MNFRGGNTEPGIPRSRTFPTDIQVSITGERTMANQILLLPFLPIFNFQFHGYFNRILLLLGFNSYLFSNRSGFLDK